MAIKVQIPAPLRQHTDGKATVELDGATVGAVLQDAVTRYPGLGGRLFDNGQLRRFVNLYLNEEDVRYLQNLNTPVQDGDDLAIIPAVAGGGR